MKALVCIILLFVTAGYTPQESGCLVIHQDRIHTVLLENMPVPFDLGQAILPDMSPEQD